MAKQLFSLYLNSASEVLQLPEGNKLQLGGNSGEGGKRKARAKAWVWVASEALVCSSVELPRGGGTSAEVIGYSLEDNLIEPIENYHLVLAARKSGQAAVMALSHKQMQQWCEALYIAERLPLGLFPDFLALPWKVGGASLHLSPQRALVRSDKFYGFATSPKLLDAVFSKLELEPEQVRVLLEPGTQLPALLVDCSQVEEYPFWQLLSAQGAPDKKSNLYQGVYTKPKGNKSFSLRPLVAGLVYACLAGGLWLGNEVQSSLTMLEQSQRYQRENRELLAMMLPEINMRAPDWREQAIKAVEAMHARGQSAFGEGEFWQSMEKVSKLMRRCDPCLIRSLTYQEQELELIFSSYVYSEDNFRANAEQILGEQLSWNTSRSFLNGNELFQNQLKLKL